MRTVVELERSTSDNLEVASDIAMELADATDRGLVFCSATRIEQKLGEILHEFLSDNESTRKLLDGPLATLQARAEACHSLALIDGHEFADCEHIGQMTAEFHRTANVGFFSDRIVALCRKLHFQRAGGSSPAARQRFQAVVRTLLERFANRGFYVGHEKRTRRQWAT